MSLILENAAARRVVADLCDELGLAIEAARLRTPSAQNAGLLRPMLLDVGIAARAVHQAAAHAFIKRLTVMSEALESAQKSALTACDRLLEEEFAAREAPKTDRPILSTSRHMNIHRPSDR